MFRRRRFRPIRQVLNNQNQPVLRRAHELMSLGEFEPAASIYEQLAQGAQARRIPQDAYLFLIAGRCRIQARQIDLAMADLKQGLEILSTRGKVRNFYNACQKSIDELSIAGYKAESSEITQLRNSSFDVTPSISQPDKNEQRGILPLVCTSCGGALHSDEVEWTDDFTVECPWCGSAIRTNRE